MSGSENEHDLDCLRRTSSENEDGLREVFAKYRERLKRMVNLRLNPRIQGRLDASDVVQDAMAEAFRTLDDYLQAPQFPVFLWLRLITGQKLLLAHRQHLGVQARDAAREISLFRGALPEASSAALAAQLMGRLTSPSQAAMKAEMRLQLQELLNRMAPIDREVLTLRHFEQLSNSETATVLGIQETTACNRYIRALERLKGLLNPQSLPGAE